jgi:hypothetical protein
MARYTGPKQELLVNGEAIFGDDKASKEEVTLDNTGWLKKEEKI